jgi:hypothetical protein
MNEGGGVGVVAGGTEGVCQNCTLADCLRGGWQGAGTCIFEMEQNPHTNTCGTHPGVIHQGSGCCWPPGF